MTAGRFIQTRQNRWKKTEEILSRLERTSWRKKIYSEDLLAFSRLHRALCTDMSLAAAYEMPANIVDYLRDLTERGHSVLYPGNKSYSLRRYAFETIPQTLRKDVYVLVGLLVFYVPLVFSTVLAYFSSGFAEALIGEQMLTSFYSMHSGERFTSPQSVDKALSGTGFYIMNNVSISFLSFGLGVIGAAGTLIYVIFNSIFLGTVFGFLFSSPAAENIILWILPHAVFELTAIGVMAGAGMRIGFSWISPGRLSRAESMKVESMKAVPVAVFAATIMAIAAFLEGFIAPSSFGLLPRLTLFILSILILVAYIFGVGHQPEAGDRN